MGTFIEVGLVIIIALVILSAAFRELGHGIRGFAVVTRGVMEVLGVRPEMAATPRQRAGAIAMTLLIMAGVASCIGLVVHWAFFS